MASSANLRIGEHFSNPKTLRNEPSKGKTIGFAILIILGFGGLVTAGVGLGGYLQAGSLSSMGQINAIIMMAAGAGGGIVFLIVGIVGSVKNRQKNERQQMDSNEGTEHKSDARTHSEPIKNINITKAIDTYGGLIYGADAWKVWNVEVVDKVPEAPKVDFNNKDKILLYIPQRIKVSGKEKVFNLKALKEITVGPFKYFSVSVDQQFGNATAAGWVLIDKTVLLDSLLKNYQVQKKMVEEKGCCMPSVLEAIVLNLMVFAFTGDRLYGDDPCIYIRCAEKVNGTDTVVVGGFGSRGLGVASHINQASEFYGVVCVQRKF